MNRQQRRASETHGRRLQRLDWNEFQDVTQEAYAKACALGGNRSYRPDAVFQNNKYIVQIFTDCEVIGKCATRVMIRRSDSAPIYSWQDLFRIKNEIFGDEAVAIQVFPKVSELIDDANLYWLWLLKDGE